MTTHPVKTARFYHYHCRADGPVRISVRIGETVRHSWGGSTDEGWSRESYSWSFDGSRVLSERHSDGRDCDGRLTTHDIVSCDLAQLQAGPAYDGVRYPVWDTISQDQRDEFAEAMGY